MNTNSKTVFALAFCAAATAFGETVTVDEMNLTANVTVDVAEGSTQDVVRLTGGAYTITKTGGGTLNIYWTKNENARIVVEEGVVALPRYAKPTEVFAKAHFHVDASDPSTLETTYVSGTNFVVRWNDADQKWYTYQGDERVLYTGIAQNENGWWYCENGTVDFGCTGIKHNDNGWWRVEGGKVNFDANGIYQNEYGWWKTTNGRVTFQENGIFPNEYGWWKVVNSKVDFDYTGVAKNDYGWWRVKKGKVDFNANGIYSNEYGKWYVKNGKVDFSKNGKVTFNGKKYQVTNGKATRIK